MGARRVLPGTGMMWNIPVSGSYSIPLAVLLVLVLTVTSVMSQTENATTAETTTTTPVATTLGSQTQNTTFAETTITIAPVVCPLQNDTYVVPETAPVNTCTPASFLCSSSSDIVLRGVNLTSSTADRFYAIGGTRAQQTEVTVQICANRSVFDLPPGSYQQLLTITYDLLGVVNYEFVGINVTVSDVNESPVIVMANSTVTVNVSEKAPRDSDVITFTVTDPDAAFSGGVASYKTITSVTVRRLGEERDTAVSEFPLRDVDPQNGLYKLVVGCCLNASQTDQYTLSIEARDGAGLLSAYELNITVIDENEIPRCVSELVSATVNVGTPVGTALAKLDCYDWDVTPSFRELVFTPSTLFSALLDISSNGTLVLTRQVALTDQVFTDTVRVSNPASSALSFPVTVQLFVRNYPPSCTPTQVAITMPDSMAVGSCLDGGVQCVTVERSQLNGSEISAGPLIWTIHESDVNNASSLNFQVCANETLYHHLNQYILRMNISNSTGSTQVMWTMTIVDTNQAPKFLQDGYDIQLSEVLNTGSQVGEVKVVTSLPQGSEVTPNVITVFDPDNVTQDFQFSTINISHIQVSNSSGNYAESSSDVPILLQVTSTQPPSYMFVNTAGLPAGTNITFFLQAYDGQGLTGSTAVHFNIYDLNEPPSCNGDYLNSTVDLSAQPGAVLLVLPCTDPDINPAFSTLTFHEYPTNDYTYFSIANGTVVLESYIPLSSQAMTYEIYVRDGQGLTTNFTVYFNVTRDSPPDCSPLVSGVGSVPEDAGVNTCSTIIVVCTYGQGVQSSGHDITLAFHSYNQTLFLVSEIAGEPSTSHTILVCVVGSLMGLTANYSFSATAAGLYGSRDFQWTISVEDVNQPPQFDQDQYVFSVTEKLAVNSVVAQLITGLPTDSGRSAPYTIRVTDPDTSAAFRLESVTVTGYTYRNSTGLPGQGDGISGATGDLLVYRNLSAGDSYEILFYAIDKAGLSAQAVVYVNVTDVNDPPTCDVAVAEIRLNVTTPTGQEVFQLPCRDDDVDNAYSSLAYWEYPDDGSNFFDVFPSNGVISLENTLPLNRTQVTYNAYVIDGGGLVTNISLLVKIDADIGPNCTPDTVVNVTLLETDAPGVCGQQTVTCQDPIGRNLTLTITRDETQGQLALRESSPLDMEGTRIEVCVQNIGKGQFVTAGQFEIRAELSNPLAVTSLVFRVEVVDVNQPPYFLQPAYSVTVPEDAVLGPSALAVVADVNMEPQPGLFTITYGDPDLAGEFAVSNFSISVQVRYPNGSMETIPSTGAGPIVFVGDAVLATDLLRPDLVYDVGITVTDGQGISAETTLSVYVTDVNQPPSCPSTSAVLDLLEPAQSVIYTVNCSDPDFDDTFRSISYVLSQAFNSTFFDVTLDGQVTLTRSIPRDTELLTLPVLARDGGGLEADFTVRFNISRDHPPDCQPSYQPPDVWLQNACFTVYPNCSDPTTPAGDKRYLTYNFTDYQAGFVQSRAIGNSSDFASFCYTLTVNGNYKISLEVSNGLGVTSWEQSVQVAYLQSPPKFSVNRYLQRINETQPVDSVIDTVEALVNGKTASLLYSLVGDVYLQYFSIDSVSGAVRVSSDLSPLANKDVQFNVKAEDPQTGLEHSVPFEVIVVDINQPPTCSPTTLTVNILWSVKDTDTVATVNCSDLDPSPAFSALRYSVEQRGVWISNGPEVRLITHANLDPDRGQYVITVTASDLFFSATTSVTINVDRTPPSPAVWLMAVGVTNATVAWTLDPLYYTVIETVIVTLYKEGVAVVNRTVGRNANFSELSPLTAETAYRVEVTLVGKASARNSTLLAFTTKAVQVLNYTSVEVRILNRNWTTDHLNDKSAAFQTLAQEITSSVFQATPLRDVPGFVGLSARSFRKGSVLADMVMVTNQSLGSMEQLREAARNTVQSGALGALVLDQFYFFFYNGGTYIANVAHTYQSPGRLNDATNGDIIITGYDVTSHCSARTPGVSNPTFEWTLNGRDVSSMTSSSRYSVSAVTRGPDDPYRFSRTFTLRGILKTESGPLQCKVKAGDKTDSRLTILTVVDRLSASLTTPDQVVTSGSDVQMRCVRNAGYTMDWRATLFRVDDQNGLSLVSANNVSAASNTTVLTVRGVVTDSRYVCQVRDALATATSNQASLTIKATGGSQCPVDGAWPKTPQNKTVLLPCPPEYVPGYFQSRTCSRQGVWLNVNSTNCVRQDLQDLKTTVEQITEGTSGVTTAQVLDDLANSTADPLLAGDVAQAVDILDMVAAINDRQNLAPGEDELKKFVESADNVLQAPSEVWQNQTSQAFSLIDAVDKMGTVASKGLAENATESRPISTNKIVLQVVKTERKDLEFPIRSQAASYPDWVIQQNNTAYVPEEAFHPSILLIRYSGAIFTNLSNVLSGYVTDSSDESINSAILAVSLAIDNTTISKPIRLQLQHITTNFSSTSCNFLNLSKSGSGGVWSDGGCRAVETYRTYTVCECDHLTNFAVLMSPYRPPVDIADVLNIFSIVGCGVSIFCLLLTLLIYFIYWRNVKSDRSVILVNLCVILILAYVTFLAGVNRVEYEIVCTVVAAVLHYLWLVVFFLMLCEGLDIFISVVIVFPIKSVLLKLLMLAYGVPAVVVGVSLGVTQLDGYGGEDFCWLSLEGGLLWAFVGPACAALLANYIFVAFVIRALLSSTAMITKATRGRAKSILKAICVMTPILGLTWVFGVVSVNHETLVFQILFVVFNSLQGLMIFVFHCFLSKQVREGIKNTKRRYQAKSAASGDSSAKYSNQKRTSEASLSGNDLDKKTVSPFLQVDRQANQVSAKIAMVDNHNLLVADEPPKSAAVKTPIAGPADDLQGSQQRFNILQSESFANGDSRVKDAVDSSMVRPEFRIEAGNLKTCSATPSPSATVTTGRPGPTALKTTATTQAVIEGSQDRLDHVYGAGARISDDGSSTKVYGKSKGSRSTQSTENIRMTSAPRNPVYNDVVPSLSPTDRWIRAAHAVRQQPHPQGLQTGVYRGQPDPFLQHPYPASPRRLAGSVDSLGATHFPAFADPRTAARDPRDGRDARHRKGHRKTSGSGSGSGSGSRSSAPKVAPKPVRWQQHDPPVDYW